MTAIAGQTHDLALNGAGFMLAQTAKGTTHYKKTLAGNSRPGLTPGTATTLEVLQGAARQPVTAFRRAIWSKWSGLGQGMVAGANGWEQAQTAGKVYDLLSLRPVQDGGALALAPQLVDAQVAATTPNFSRYAFYTYFGDTYMALVDQIYKSANPGTNSSGFAFLGAAANPVFDICQWSNTLYVSTSAHLYTLNTTTGVLTAAATPTDRQVEYMANFQNILVASIGSALVWWIPARAVWDGPVYLDGAITSLVEYDGSLFIGTVGGLYKLSGQLKAKSPSTAPTVLDWFDYELTLVWRVNPWQVSGVADAQNFSKMASWRGSLWAFVGGQLYRIKPATNAADLKVEAQPVRGSGRGLAVCGQWLVAASVQITGSTLRTVWVNETGQDGALGWWKLSEGGATLFPFPNAGYDQGLVNLVHNSIATTNFYRCLVDTSSPVGFSYNNYGITRTVVTGQVTLPIITPEDLAALAGAANGKVLAVNLRRVGVEWSMIDGGRWWPSMPPDGLTMAAFNLAIEVSANSGVSWSTLVEPSTGALSLNTLWFYGNRIELPAPTSLYIDGMMYPAAPPYGGPGPFGPAPDSGWLVRVTWGGLVMPLLRRVWLDFDVAELAPQTGQEWEFEVNLQDPQIGLGGGVDPAGDAAYKAGQLTGLAKSGQSVFFSDLDGQTYLVRVVGFDLKRVSPGVLPAVAPGWQGAIRLEEVWPGN